MRTIRWLGAALLGVVATAAILSNALAADILHEYDSGLRPLTNAQQTQANNLLSPHWGGTLAELLGACIERGKDASTNDKFFVTINGCRTPTDDSAWDAMVAGKEVGSCVPEFVSATEVTVQSRINAANALAQQLSSESGIQLLRLCFIRGPGNRLDGKVVGLLRLTKAQANSRRRNGETIKPRGVVE